MEIDAHIHVYSPQLAVQDAPIIIDIYLYLAFKELVSWIYTSCCTPKCSHNLYS